MTTSNPPPCTTCGNSKEWHEANPHVHHKFNDGSLPVSATFGKRRADGSSGPPAEQQGTEVPSPWPFDPVLRQALVDKGILTSQDLVDAEIKIRVITSQVEVEHGKQRGR